MPPARTGGSRQTPQSQKSEKRPSRRPGGGGPAKSKAPPPTRPPPPRQDAPLPVVPADDHRRRRPHRWLARDDLQAAGTRQNHRRRRPAGPEPQEGRPAEGPRPPRHGLGGGGRRNPPRPAR